MTLKECKTRLKELNKGQIVKIRLRKRSGGYSIFLVYEKVENGVRHKDKRTTGLILSLVKREHEKDLIKIDKALKMKERFETDVRDLLKIKGEKILQSGNHT